MSNVILAVVNERNEVIDARAIDPDSLILPGEAVVTLYPGVPPLNSPEFASQLRQWHAEHNQFERIDYHDKTIGL